MIEPLVAFNLSKYVPSVASLGIVTESVLEVGVPTLGVTGDVGVKLDVAPEIASRPVRDKATGDANVPVGCIVKVKFPEPPLGIVKWGGAVRRTNVLVPEGFKVNGAVANLPPASVTFTW